MVCWPPWHHYIPCLHYVLCEPSSSQPFQWFWPSVLITYAQSNVGLTSVVKNLALAGSYLMATVSVLNTVCSMLRTSLRATAIHRKRGLKLAKNNNNGNCFLHQPITLTISFYIRLSISLRKNIFHFQTITMALDKNIRYIILFKKLH